MKALLISESDEILNSYAAFFKETGYDTVCYRWLLKAMDNLEEIEPQLVFIDGFGYPRHWKTLAQHIKTSFKNAPLVLLAADLSEEEAKKADCLDVHCISGSIEDEQTRRDIVLLLQQEPEVSAEPVEEIEEPVVPAADPIQTAEPVEFAEPSEEPANPEPTTTPSLNDGEPVSASTEELAECEAEPVQPEVEPAEQSANPEPTTAPSLDGEPVSASAEELAEPVETADFPEPAEIAELETFAPEPVESEELAKTADFSEQTETAEPETFAPVLEMSDPPVFAAIAEPEQEQAATVSETAVLPETPEPVEEIEEPERIDDEPFFSAPAQTSLSDSEVFSFTFFHPRTKTAIYGSVISFKHPLLYFKPDDSSVLRTLRFGQKSSGIINDKGLTSNVSVQIQGFENDSIELCLLK